MQLLVWEMNPDEYNHEEAPQAVTPPESLLLYLISLISKQD